MFPIATPTGAVKAFHHRFPATPLRLHVEAMGAVLQPLLDGHCRIAVIGSLPEIAPGCACGYLLEVPTAIVAAPGHPRAQLRPPLTCAGLARHVQLVLTDRSSLTAGRHALAHG